MSADLSLRIALLRAFVRDLEAGRVLPARALGYLRDALPAGEAGDGETAAYRISLRSNLFRAAERVGGERAAVLRDPALLSVSRALLAVYLSRAA